MTLIDTLHRRGLGTRSIAALTGYSQTTVLDYLKDLARPRHTPRTISQAIIANLPPDLAADCLRVRLKGEAANARGEARVLGVCVARAQHELVGEWA